MKLAILAEGQLARATAKTAIGVLRYAPYPVVAVVDSTRSGTDTAAHIGVGKGVPVVATVDEALALGAEALLIGTAAAGGRIADTYRPHLARALERGVTVWNGLHERVLSDPALAAAAKRRRGRRAHRGHRRGGGEDDRVARDRRRAAPAWETRRLRSHGSDGHRDRR